MILFQLQVEKLTNFTAWFEMRLHPLSLLLAYLSHCPLFLEYCVGTGGGDELTWGGHSS